MTDTVQQDHRLTAIENIIKNNKPNDDMAKAVIELLGLYHPEDYRASEYLHDAYIIMESVKLLGYEPFMKHVTESDGTLNSIIGGIS